MKQVNGQGNISDALLACSITFPIQMVIAFAIASVEEKRERKPRLVLVFGLFFFLKNFPHLYRTTQSVLSFKKTKLSFCICSSFLDSFD